MQHRGPAAARWGVVLLLIAATCCGYTEGGSSLNKNKTAAAKANQTAPDNAGDQPSARDLTAAPLAADKESQGFLLPILLNGPNNQKRDLRNYLALARQLGRRVVLTGLVKHYMELSAAKKRRGGMSPNNMQPGMALPACFDESKHGYMPMDRVLDTEWLQDTFGAISIADLRKQGWDGKLDALVHTADPKQVKRVSIYVKRTCEPASVSLDGAVRIPFSPDRISCNATALEELRAAIKPYKYVAMSHIVLGKTVNPNLVHEQVADVQKLQGCERALADGTRALHPAPWMRAIADRYVRSVIGSRKFLCVHVRPYGDTCLEGYMQAEGLSAVFVMAHPIIRHIVHRKLEKVGMTNISFVDAALTEELAGCQDHSASFLALVEESICAQAAHFMGTHQSSISQSLGFIRLGLGRMANTYFESSTCGRAATQRQLSSRPGSSGIVSSVEHHPTVVR